MKFEERIEIPDKWGGKDTGYGIFESVPPEVLVGHISISGAEINRLTSLVGYETPGISRGTLGIPLNFWGRIEDENPKYSPEYSSLHLSGRIKKVEGSRLTVNLKRDTIFDKDNDRIQGKATVGLISLEMEAENSQAYHSALDNIFGIKDAIYNLYGAGAELFSPSRER